MKYQMRLRSNLDPMSAPRTVRGGAMIERAVSRLSAWGLAVAILLVTSVLAVLLQPVLAGEVSSGLIFVLGITVIGARSGLLPALLAAILASALFNFFLAEPVLTFRMTRGEDLAPPTIFTLCAIISGVLSGRLKDQTLRVQQANVRLESLLETSRTLQRATTDDEVFAALKSTVPARLGINLALYRIGEFGPEPVSGSSRDDKWLRAAELSDEAPHEYLRIDGLSCYKTSAAERAASGILVCDEPEVTALERDFMLALAQMIALALERAHLAARIAEVQAQARAEELKTALLSSVSHDLRTPLTTIRTSASSLLTFREQFDAETSAQLLSGIVDECDRLNHLTANLLEMTRLQGGPGSLHHSVLPLAEMVRKVLGRAKRQAGTRKVTFVAPRDEIQVVSDAALMELALTNVVQNAINYSADGSHIDVRCAVDGPFCLVSISDEGVGVPTSEQARVFERFYRVQRSDGAPKGTGLGLAIAKGFVEAYGGSIQISSPGELGSGTTVTIRLPRADEVRVA